MDAEAELLLCRRTAVVGWRRGVGEERHQTLLEADLAVGHVDGSGVATVPVEEHELARRCRSDAVADVVEHGEQRRRPQPDRARRPRVLVGTGVGERWQEPGVELFAHLVHRSRGDGVGDEHVGVERQVRSVLLDGAERLHDDAVLTERRGHLVGAQVGEVPAHLTHRRHVSDRAGRTLVRQSPNTATSGVNA